MLKQVDISARIKHSNFDFFPTLLLILYTFFYYLSM